MQSMLGQAGMWSTYAAVLVAASLLCFSAGRAIGRRELRMLGPGYEPHTATIDGAVFALLGLLVAFSFSGAASRFDQRRAEIIAEANAIGTAWSRVALLPPPVQGPVREAFRQYVDSRIRTYQLLPDEAAAKHEAARAGGLQNVLFERARVAADGSQPVLMLLLPALNDAFDRAADRAAAVEIHPPPVIFVLLIGIALLAATLAGFSTAASPRAPWLHAIIFALVLGCAIYVILDLEFPRIGLIRVDALDHLLVEARRSMD